MVQWLQLIVFEFENYWQIDFVTDKSTFEIVLVNSIEFNLIFEHIGFDYLVDLFIQFDLSFEVYEILIG
jgi:hypothetical protein